MKQLVVGLVAAFGMSGAFAQSPDALVHAVGSVQVQAMGGSAQVGDRAVPEGGSAAANAGDTVKVTSGTAKVTYANGCSVTVESGAFYKVAEKAPQCQIPDKVVGSENNYYVAGIVGMAAVIALASGGSGDDTPSSP